MPVPSVRVPPEHLDTMRVLREALYLMSKLGGAPDYVDFWQLRSRLFEPVMRELEHRSGNAEELRGILEKWLLRQSDTDDTIDRLAAMEGAWKTC